MKKLLTLLLIAFASQASAQHYLWKTFGGYVAQGTIETGQAMVRDNAGNLYVASNINFPVLLQGNTIFHLTPGLSDVYIAKFNPQGQHIWIKKFGCFGNGDFPFDLAVDDSANIYVFEYSSLPNIVFEDNIVNLSGAIALKLDSSGNFKWARKIQNC